MKNIALEVMIFLLLCKFRFPKLRSPSLCWIYLSWQMSVGRKRLWRLAGNILNIMLNTKRRMWDGDS